MGKMKTNRELMDKGYGKARDVLSEKGHSDTEKLLATIVLYLNKITDPFEERPAESDISRCKDMLDEMLSVVIDIKERVYDCTGDDPNRDAVSRTCDNIAVIRDTLNELSGSVEEICDKIPSTETE